MVQIGGNLPAILANRKSTSDFMREAEEFEAKKRANVLGEKMAQIGLIQAERDLTQPQGAFTGDSWDAQVGNVAYEKFLSDGLDPMSAKQAAADAVLKSKMDYTMVTDPYTGQQTPVAKPRAAIFGGGQTAPPYGGAQGQGSNPAIELPYDQIPPLDLAGIENMTQDAGSGNGEFNPNSPGMNMLGKNTPATNNIFDMPAAQGAEADRKPYGPYIDPRAMASPDVQKDLARKQGELQLKSQDPEFMLKARELGLKEDDAKKKMETAKLAADQISTVINDLVDEKGNLRFGVEQIVGGPMGMRGRQSSMLPVTEAQRKYQPYINQITGQAFLQAFEVLKGGGQITQIEGEKATQAITRLAQYQSSEDFAQALRDLKEYAQKVKKTTNAGQASPLVNNDVQSLINKYAD